MTIEKRPYTDNNLLGTKASVKLKYVLVKKEVTEERQVEDRSCKGGKIFQDRNRTDNRRRERKIKIETKGERNIAFLKFIGGKIPFV